MIIQFNTDNNVNGTEEFVAPYKGQIENKLERFNSRITRIEVHLSDEDGTNKDGLNTKRCLMEARLEGRQPISVTNIADNHDQAVSGALDKLTNSLDSMMGRMISKRRL